MCSLHFGARAWRTWPGDATNHRFDSVGIGHVVGPENSHAKGSFERIRVRQILNEFFFQVSSVQVTNAFIARIKQVNPLLNCVVDERFDEALNEAADADKLIASGKLTERELEEQKPYLGVPISTKDCIEVNGEFFLRFSE